MPRISFNGIGVPTPSGSSIDDAWVEYKGSRATEVPAGEPFRIRAHGFANIPGQTTGAEILFTAKSNDGSIYRYDTTRPMLGGPIYETPNMWLKYDQNGETADPIMPNSNITIIFKLWGNDLVSQPIPPLSSW